VPGKVAQFNRFLLSQGTGMASLVMTALQWTEKWGRKALGLSLSGGVSHKRARRPGEWFSGLGSIFLLLFQQMYIVLQRYSYSDDLGAFGGYDERARPLFVTRLATLLAANELRAELKFRNTDHM